MAINRNLSILAQGASSTGNLLNYTGANKIINGDMAIDQRNSGASVTPTVNGSYTLDRWCSVFSAASKFSVQQNAGSVAVLSGMPKDYAGITSLSSYSLSSTDYFFFAQYIEGLNCSNLNFGSSIASDITLSFWVRSSLTGTFGGVLQNSAQNRSYCFSYSIAAANTWTKISIAISGDQSGTWLTTNGIGLRVFFALGIGSTYKGTPAGWSATPIFAPTGAVDVVATNGATWYVTGVKVELGTVATPFVPDDYNTSLWKCFRYYEKQTWNGAVYAWIGFSYDTTAGYGMVQYAQKRTNPAVTFPLATILNTAGKVIMSNAAGNNSTGAGTFNPANATPGLERLRVDFSGFTGLTAQAPSACYVAPAGSAIFAVDAEF